MKPRFFRSAGEMRRWLARNHEKVAEIWVGFYKRAAGTRGITYSEALDQALCFGWIDGVRRTEDSERYTIRFTPRSSRSRWSAINRTRFQELAKRGLVAAAGRRAFDDRDRTQPRYSYEGRPQKLDAPYEKELRGNKEAWAFFQAQPPWYRRTAAFWVMDAKKDETRRRRLARLIADSESGQRIAPLRRRSG